MDSATVITFLPGVGLTHLGYALIIVSSFLGLSSLYLAIKLHRLSCLYEKMMNGATGESIEKMMLGRLKDIDELKKSTTELRNECVRLEKESQKHVQHVGVVRFNAFDNTGSDLSFAVAMMDASKSGFILSGIYGREESRVYAKPIKKGESSYTLTKEEKHALDDAWGK